MVLVRRTAALIGTALMLALWVAPAAAQYFGRNKVRYQRFDFRVLATEHFDVYYYDAEKDAAERAARIAERWYARLSRVLNHTLEGRQPLILYAAAPHFQQTNAIEGDLGEGTGGVTEVFKRRIVLPMAATPAETDHVIGHELVHAFQYDLAGRGATMAGAGLSRMPLWFVEGMAEYLSQGADDPHTAMWMRDAAASNDLPSWSRLGDPRYFPYRYGQALWAYVAGRWGEDRVATALKAVRRASSAEAIVREVLGVGPDTLVSEWHQAIRDAHEPIGRLMAPSSSIGRTLVAPLGDRGRINVSPSLSPDGSRMMFLSERDQFSIDLYLADARDGRVLRRVTRTAVDPHFQSLQFLQSAGAWSADGSRFAIATLASGRPVLALLDGSTLATRQEILLPQVDEAFGPTWSPDGGRIAFSGMTGGATDLFVVDVRTREVRRLTSDPDADLMPAWSPDGRHIAFVTDREGARLDSLAYGNERVALIDAGGGTPRVLPGQDRGKHINPQWTADGRHLLLVSDRDGIAQVYRMDVEGGAVQAVTRIMTGITGITRLGPALAVARNADAAVVSVYERGSYSLVALDPRATATIPAELAATSPTLLPPRQRRDAGYEAVLASAGAGPARPSTFQRRPYRASLSLDAVGQPSLGVATGSNGVSFGGGAGLYWSDMLGHHQLMTGAAFANAGSRFLENLTGVVSYENRRRRWDWGLTVAQLPYFTREFVVDEGLYDGRPAVREREFRDWQIDRQALGIWRYPFNRVARAELTAGYRQVGFASELETRIYDTATGEPLERTVVDLSGDSLSALHFGTAGGALVYDNSVFGGTSPVAGQRARVEVLPVFGDLDYVGVLGDGRRYESPWRSLAVAGRLLHFGRYGRSAQSDILQQLYAGYPWFVHGYDPASFSFDECPPGEDCSGDRLAGSRIAVANAEVRLMLLGPLGWIPSAGFLPVETAAFFDAGVGWIAGEQPAFLGGSRTAATSHGVALRINLFGYAVGEAALVHPNDRPGKGWHWQLSLQPGF